MLLSDEEGRKKEARKKEATKVIQTTKQMNTAHPRQSRFQNNPVHCVNDGFHNWDQRDIDKN